MKKTLLYSLCLMINSEIAQEEQTIDQTECNDTDLKTFKIYISRDHTSDDYIQQNIQILALICISTLACYTSITLLNSKSINRNQQSNIKPLSSHIAPKIDLLEASRSTCQLEQILQPNSDFAAELLAMYKLYDIEHPYNIRYSELLTLMKKHNLINIPNTLHTIKLSHQNAEGELQYFSTLTNVCTIPSIDTIQQLIPHLTYKTFQIHIYENIHKKDKSQQRTGLINHNNYCFMNASLQALVHLDVMREPLLNYYPDPNAIHYDNFIHSNFKTDAESNVRQQTEKDKQWKNAQKAQCIILAYIDFLRAYICMNEYGIKYNNLDLSEHREGLKALLYPKYKQNQIAQDDVDKFIGDVTQCLMTINSIYQLFMLNQNKLEYAILPLPNDNLIRSNISIISLLQIEPLITRKIVFLNTQCLNIRHYNGKQQDRKQPWNFPEILQIPQSDGSLKEYQLHSFLAKSGSYNGGHWITYICNRALKQRDFIQYNDNSVTEHKIKLTDVNNTVYTCRQSKIQTPIDLIPLTPNILSAIFAIQLLIYVQIETSMTSHEV